MSNHTARGQGESANLGSKLLSSIRALFGLQGRIRTVVPSAAIHNLPNDTDTARLMAVIRALVYDSLCDLRDPHFVANRIRAAGLVFDERMLYGADNQYMNFSRAGLWQIPMQLARCLVHLSKYHISKIIEVGTWSGWTISFMTAYLLRFNSNLEVVTVDVADEFGFGSSPMTQSLPIVFHKGTSADFRGQVFDLAFIDADHSYTSCLNDYESVGRTASICMFHDINDQYVIGWKGNRGGVPTLWGELSANLLPQDHVLEFLDHSEGDRTMGIGLIVRKRATLRREL